ncbi:MAG TPA: TolC family protein, partial [Myxococcaceae bacterium]|nr:TolC family protein [Myxococcaceae bacterium]
MSDSRNPYRVRRAVPGMPLVLALVVAASATGQERSTTPLISVDAGFTAATAESPDAVRPVARKISLREAVAQALERNATARVAAADIRRVGGLMEQTRAASLPTLSVNATYTRLNKELTAPFPGANGGTENVTIAAKDSLNIKGSLSIPILAPQAWADWSRAADQLENSKFSERDVQRTVGITTARAYLTVFAQRRQVEVNRQARDNA